MPTVISTCPQCGAPLAGEDTCRVRFEQMLALEYENPALFGAVHHLTVPAYYLQHPAEVTPAALEWMQATLRAFLQDGISVAEFRRRAQARFDGAQSNIKRKDGQTTPPLRTHWAFTLDRVRLDGPEQYANDIRAWAAATLQDLEAR